MNTLYSDKVLRVLMKTNGLSREEYEGAAREYKKAKSSAAGSQPPEAPDKIREHHINNLLDIYMKKLNLGQFEVSQNPVQHDLLWKELCHWKIFRDVVFLVLCDIIRCL